MFNFLGTIAEYFLDLNRERTLEGLKAAAARVNAESLNRIFVRSSTGTS